MEWVLKFYWRIFWYKNVYIWNIVFLKVRKVIVVWFIIYFRNFLIKIYIINNLYIIVKIKNVYNKL